MEERELVRRSQEGDKASFGLLVQRYQTKVYRLAYGFTRNAVTADDLAQDIFLKAWFGLRRFKSRSGFGTWLYRIAVNHLKDHLRKKTSNREISLDRDIRETAYAARQSLDSRIEEEAQQVELVHRALAALPEKYRLILTLRDIQGLAYGEISRTLKISGGTVDSRLFRARRMLRARVEYFLGRGRR